MLSSTHCVRQKEHINVKSAPFLLFLRLVLFFRLTPGADLVSPPHFPSGAVCSTRTFHFFLLVAAAPLRRHCMHARITFCTSSEQAARARCAIPLTGLAVRSLEPPKHRPRAAASTLRDAVFPNERAIGMGGWTDTTANRILSSLALFVDDRKGIVINPRTYLSLCSTFTYLRSHLGGKHGDTHTHRETVNGGDQM